MRTSRAVCRAILGLAAAAGGLAGGCGGQQAGRDYDLLYSSIEPIDYARILCRGIAMQDQHTCMTSVLQHYHDTRYDRLDTRQITGGPFVLVLDDDLYRGTYVSQPFASAFTVSNGSNICRGRYDAFGGDTRADFAVYCEDGSSGIANIILDVDGRNGIGEMNFDDGRRGDIVFGHRAVGGDFF
jgi:hypothetical protein